MTTTIYTVRDNLKNTIKGKEVYIQELAEKAEFAVFPKNLAYHAMTEMLDLNITELKNILAHVEICCNQASEASWQGDVDRMSGAFTQDEIDRSRNGGW